jgi:23S rRNA pseudouridine955/2504/2580 synthase
MRSGERMVQVSEAGKASLSIFEPVEVFADASLVEVSLKTGRTHQIRVHAAHLGQPVAGDDKYGDADFNRHMQQLGLRRLFLHAAALEFTVPDTNKKVSVRAPLGADLENVLRKLRQ